MSEGSSRGNSGQEDEAPGTGALDVLVFLARHKKTLFWVPIVGALVSMVIALLLPNYYMGVSRILPPQQNQSIASMMLSQFGQATGVPAAALGLKNPNDIFVGMLRSRTVADRLIERFSLRELYAERTIEDTRRALEDRSSVNLGRDGIIVVTFEDRDPQRAAAVANGYVEELYRLTQTLAVTEAGQRRVFLEKQLKETKEALANAEVDLKKTQEQTGLIKLDDQGRAIIDAVAGLRGRIAAKEVEARAMRSFATEANPAYLILQQELAGLRAELLRMEKSSAGSGNGSIFVPTGRVPEAGLEYVRRLRDVKYHETVFELLAKQFEIAKIEEAREGATIQVLDRAVEPDRKSRPHRAIIVIVITLLSFVGALLWAVLREAYAQAQRDPIQSGKIEAIRSLLKRSRAP